MAFYRKIIRLLQIGLFIAAGLLVLSACVWKVSSRPSFLIIAVESLSFEDLPCDRTSRMLGFATLCDEAVRFTHAFTPSIMSQAALASIFTAKYPFEHGVRHNGDNLLPAREKTVAEVGIEKGYRTALFSGGPPIWRKSGLGQGFEIFEDNVRVGLHSLYRPAEQTFTSFLNWLDHNAQSDPFFAVAFLADLQFADEPTVTDLGEERGRSYESQLQEIGESLSHLVNELKVRHRWNNTYVILAGLNGRQRRLRPGELDSISLFSENSQVSLLVKPASRGQRDLGIEWKIDKNVSLVDVGATLFDLFDAWEPEESALEVISFKEVFRKPEANWDADRVILVESFWPQWRGVGVGRVGVRQGFMFLQYDNPIKVYNTLIDRSETAPVFKEDPLYQSTVQKIEPLLQRLKFQKFEPLPLSLSEKLAVANELWRRSQPSDLVHAKLARLQENRAEDEQIVHWGAQIALKNQDWKALEELGKKYSQDLWIYVAAKNQKQSTFALKVKGCGVLFVKNRASQAALQECEDELLKKLVSWANEKDDFKRNYKQDEFIKLYVYAKLDQRIGQLHYVNWLTWDVDAGKPGLPLLADLYLALPKAAGLKERVRRAIGSDVIY